MSVTFYHNPRCSKSRAVKDILKAHSVEARVVEYLKEPLSTEELRKLITALDGPAAQLIRTGEPQFRETGLSPEDLSETQVIELLLRQPVLLQRPVVICGNRARIGRPPERVLEVLA